MNIMATPPSRGGGGVGPPAGGHSADGYPARNSGGGGGGGGGSRPATQLEFTQAMTDFKVMFPDMDSEVIEAVLRANNGAVDATIDHLLTMSADNEAEKVLHSGGGSGKRHEDHPPAYVGNPPSYQQATQGNY